MNADGAPPEQLVKPVPWDRTGSPGTGSNWARTLGDCRVVLEAPPTGTSGDAGGAADS